MDEIRPLMLVVAPVASQSGYGAHARDIVRSILKYGKFDVKIFSVRWGNTPMTALIPGKDDEIINKIMQNNELPRKPDISVQILIPPEFQQIATYNIGITAGIETTLCHPEWIEGLNKMDLNIVPSEHAKRVFASSEFTKNDNGKPIAHLKLQKPILVLFEGGDTDIYKRKDVDLDVKISDYFNHIKEQFCFLFVGHWLQGNVGHDRKDVGMLIKTFLETFKDNKNSPALVLKTSHGTYSIIDQEEIIRRIEEIKRTVLYNEFLPNIYLIHGELTDEEMNSLYNHPKIKSMVSFTKGEGFGRPLLEFSLVGKPIICSAWGGQVDFLDKEYCLLVSGKVEKVDPSAVNKFIIAESSWFTVNYNEASGIMKLLYNEYNKFLPKAKKLMYNNKEKFSLVEMDRKLAQIFDKFVPDIPVEIPIKLPVKKLTIPKPKVKIISEQGKEK